MKIELIGIPQQQNDTKEFKERQQNIDALLVLASIVSVSAQTSPSNVNKANDKISSLIDKI